MRALAIDPDSVLALCTLAYVQWNRVFFKSADDPQTALLQGIAAAKRAIELNLNDVAPYIAMGLVQQTAGAAKQAITLLQQALRICPKGHYHFYYYYPVGPR